MNRKEKKIIRQMKKNREYDKIFIEYGRDIYKKYVPAKYRKRDKNKLKKEGKYEDIFNKYGEREYNKLLVKAMYDDIKQEKGKISAGVWRAKKGLVKFAKKIGFLSLLSFLEISTLFISSSQDQIDDNKIKYEEEIEKYDENIAKYAKEVKNMNLSDIQIFMKVMEDMWSNIQGYATPEKDISGFYELDLATSDGYGVCRNMASDIAKKLNKINPQYNARTLIVEMGNEGSYEIADIERNIYETNETVKEEQQEENTDSNNFWQNIIGNHMVTLVDVAEDNLTLVLDPTNPGLGMYIKGKVVMFNSNGVDFDGKEYINSIMNGEEGFHRTVEGFFESYKIPKLSIEEIKEKYGIEAQNAAIEQVKYKKNIEKNKFKEDIRVCGVNEENIKVEKNTEMNKINNRDEGRV